MLCEGVPYRDSGTDHEELMVNRNASRWLRQIGRFGILEPRDDGCLRVNWAALKTARKRA